MKLGVQYVCMCNMYVCSEMKKLSYTGSDLPLPYCGLFPLL